MNRTLAGYFGEFGGRFVPETLIAPLTALESAYADAAADPSFRRELDGLLRDYAGRPTPLYEMRRLSGRFRRARVFAKREDLLHTGAHKINNTLGQALLAKRLGKRRVIAETGAGQHGVAVATAAALMGLECSVYMGTEDMRRQALNVARMKLLGSTVIAVEAGSRTLKDATSEALRAWTAEPRDTFYIVGSVVGPHPYPTMVRDFQSVIGIETRQQVLSTQGKLPRAIVACVGGGSNAIGMFHPFVGDDVALIGVEAGGEGIATGVHAATLSAGRPGVLHGAYSYLLQDGAGQVLSTHSISAGLDYPGVGPEHSHLKATGRAAYESVTDDEAAEAAVRVAQLEGIVPALESAHAFAYLERYLPETDEGDIVVVCLSGRGDKDLDSISAWQDRQVS